MTYPCRIDVPLSAQYDFELGRLKDIREITFFQVESYKLCTPHADINLQSTGACQWKVNSLDCTHNLTHNFENLR